MKWFNIKQTVLAQPNNCEKTSMAQVEKYLFYCECICVVTILEMLLIVNAILFLFVVVSGSRQERY